MRTVSVFLTRQRTRIHGAMLMRIETLEQRAQRELDIQTKRLVLSMVTRQRDRAERTIARLRREIAALEQA